MKTNYFILTCLMLLSSSLSWTQNCLPQGILMETQEDIDNFPIDYPNCTQIDGNLVIRESIDGSINNLTALQQIRHIAGNFQLSNTDDLVDFAGLEELQSIGGDLWVFNNDGLISFTGLNKIDTIPGDLSVQNNDSLQNFTGLNQLSRIGLDLLIQGNNQLINFQGLGQLVWVGREMAIHNNNALISLSGLDNLADVAKFFTADISFFQNQSLISLNGLQKLSRVSGTLSIQSNPMLQSLHGLQSLSEVLGTLKIISNDSMDSLVGLDQLEYTGDLEIVSNMNMQTLEGLVLDLTVDRNLTVSGNSVLKDLTGLEKITSIGQDLTIQSNIGLTSLHGLSNQITTIGNDFLIFNNDTLPSLSGLEAIQEIKGELRIDSNDELQSFSGLNSLRKIGDRLYIFKNPSLQSFAGLEALEEINSWLHILRNVNLQSITSLQELTSILGLSITDNYLLESIEGLENIDYSQVSNVRISGNDSLQWCSNPGLCQYLLNGNMSTISENATGCDSPTEILQACTEVAEIHFDIFYDLNQNKVRDPGEPIHPDGSVLVEPDSNLFFVNEVVGGLLFLNTGNYVVHYNEEILPNWMLTTDSVSYNINTNNFQQSDTLYFGIYPIDFISKIQPYVNIGWARCNDIVPLFPSCSNTQTTTATGTLWLELDDKIVETNFVDVPDTMVSPNFYGWNFNNLHPGHSINPEMYFTVPGPPEIIIGDSLIINVSVEYEDMTGSYLTDTFSYQSRILCSYDPNDKQVHPSRTGDYTLFEEELIYTIRFQNTGNAVAFDVVIRDTLDSRLDPSTFRLISTSHPASLQTSLEDNSFLNFQFKDIFLPDSTSNPLGSQGFVSFRISSKDDIEDYDEIHNTAHIYFDQNPPIVTNTTRNLMLSTFDFDNDGYDFFVDCDDQNPDIYPGAMEIANNGIDEDCDDEDLISSVQENLEENNWQIFPNPTTGIIFFEPVKNELTLVRINDRTGRLLMQKTFNGKCSVDLSNEPDGLYLFEVQTKTGWMIKKFLKLTIH